MQPGAAAFCQTFIHVTIGERITIGSRCFTDGAASEVHIVGTGSIHIFQVELPEKIILETIVGNQGHFIGTVLVAVIQIPCFHLSVHNVHVWERTALRNIRVGTQLESFHFLDRSVAYVDERRRIGKVAGIPAPRMFVEQRYFSASVVEEARQTGMIDFRPVGIVREFQIETSRIEVLINAGSIQPLVADTSRYIQIEVLHTEMIGTIVEYSLEVFLSQFAESVDGVGNVSCGDSRFRRRQQTDFSQTGITSPVGG